MKNIEYYSQSNQDKWVCEYLNFKTNGYYLDIGAYDGVQTSNTFVLEKYLNWNGICIEANKYIFQNLIQNRKSININAAILDYCGTCNFSNDSVSANINDDCVDCYTLDFVLEKNNAPSIIDYMSIDIEGSEFDVLKNFNFSKWQINMITLEHNLYLNGDFNKNRLYKLLTDNGFERVVEDAVCLDEHPSVFNQPYEDWYINKKIL